MGPTVIVKLALRQAVAYGGENHSGWLPEDAAVPQPAPETEVLLDFRILRVDEGYYLEWEPHDPHPATEEKFYLWGDYYLETLDDAIRQAQLTFGLDRGAWCDP